MLVTILTVVALAVAAVLAYAAFQPKTYMISREATFTAPPEKIFPWLNNSKKSTEWMPWQAMDQKMVMSYSGPEEGVGSSSSWNSPGRMGVGSATIVESVPNQSVKTKLVYTKPFQGTQMADLTITQQGANSVVRWSVSGDQPFMGRLMCLFMNMDKMIGGSFEQGFANLKTKVE